MPTILFFVSFLCLLFVLCDGKLVALGDLHGDLSATLIALKVTKLIGESQQWIGNDTTLVQTGDIVDRGPDSLAIYSLFRRLKNEAKDSGGNVVMLQGNHELMNYLSYFHYVPRQEMTDSGGFHTRTLLFSPTGSLGSWLRQNPIVFKSHRVVFVHAGLLPSFAAMGIEQLNNQSLSALMPTIELDSQRARQVILDQPVFSGDGPLHTRDLVLGPPVLACQSLVKSLELLEAERMVVGHTPQFQGSILSRCGGRLLVIDTAMSAAYGGIPSALEVADDGVTAVYESHRVPLPLGPPPALFAPPGSETDFLDWF
mmetsp:Transcript_25449/g.58675  ORF Transcript_25449/g.58675 Transcript_25449/m.58675 type:complete len:313 (-) Transcript_25449:58-996(-)